MTTWAFFVMPLDFNDYIDIARYNEGPMDFRKVGSKRKRIWGY